MANGDSPLAEYGRASALACFGLFLACAEHQGILDLTSTPPVAAFVSGEAANNLTPDGSFVLPGAIQLSEPQVDASRAAELAKAYVRVYLRGHLDMLEKDRGRRINHALLHPCGRTFYAEPALEPLPQSVSPPIRRAYGPHWIVSLCGSTSMPEVSLAVSTLATEVKLVDGVPITTGPQGEYFRPLGIPAGSEGSPVSPERAAIEVSNATGRKIVTVPRLIQFPRRYPQMGLWLMELDAAVPFILATGAQRSSRVVLFGDDYQSLQRGIIWIPAENQPPAAEYAWITEVSGGRVAPQSGHVPRRLGQPLEVERIRKVAP